MTTVVSAGSVVGHAATTHAVDLDGEKVLFVPAGQTLHQLDRTASLLWDCLSVASTLDAVAEDLAVAFAAEKATVLRDVIAAATVLVDAGALLAEPGAVAREV
jgi:hypothetical protein